MFVSEKIIFLQMQKAGSTHATKVLRKYCDGRDYAQHEQLKDHRRYSSRLIVSSVRNPWDWYVSLWGFGCKKEGGLRDYLIKLPFSELHLAVRYLDFSSVSSFASRTLSGRPDWKRLYSDVTDTANFREWLRLILGREGQHIAMEGYASSPVKAVVGLMTYRFLALTTDYGAWMRVGRKCRTYDEVVDFADKHTIVSRVLRAETLDEDLLELLTAAGIEVSPADTATWGKHNISYRRAFSEYYDEETSRLVESRERFIVDRFGYEPPIAASPAGLARHG
jgi:predicted transcriptional regulator